MQKCPLLHVPCYGGEGCYPIRKLCDRVKDCANGYDEKPCYIAYSSSTTTTARYYYYRSYYYDSYNHDSYSNYGAWIGIGLGAFIFLLCIWCCVQFTKKRSARTSSPSGTLATPSAPPIADVSAVQITAITNTQTDTYPGYPDTNLTAINNSRGFGHAPPDSVSTPVSDTGPPSYDTLFPSHSDGHDNTGYQPSDSTIS